MRLCLARNTARRNALQNLHGGKELFIPPAAIVAIRGGTEMSKYLIKVSSDNERRLKEGEAIVRAKDRDEAMRLAWERFPEYKEVAVYLITEDKNE